MVSSSEIRIALADWLSGKTSLREFEDWFVPATWDVHKSQDAEAENLTEEIELRLSEYSDGYMSIEELKSELREKARIAKPVTVIRQSATSSELVGMDLGGARRPPISGTATPVDRWAVSAA